MSNLTILYIGMLVVLVPFIIYSLIVMRRNNRETGLK